MGNNKCFICDVREKTSDFSHYKYADCELMRELGHENKIDRFKWREYVLWDMQKKHEEEVTEEWMKKQKKLHRISIIDLSS